MTSGKNTMTNINKSLKIRELETSIITSLYLSPSCREEVMAVIGPEDFFFDDTRLFFTKSCELIDKGHEIDAVSLMSATGESMDSVRKMINHNTYSYNFSHYAQEIKKESLKRKLGKMSDAIKDKVNAEVDVLDIVKYIENEVVEATIDNTQKEAVTMKDAIDDVLSKIELLHEDPKDVSGILTGIERLDKKINGLNKTDLIILAARPGCGKSTLALQICKNAAFIEDKSTMMFSLEMGTDQLVQRILANDSKVDLWKIRSGKLDELEMQALKMSARNLQSAPLFFNDMAGINVKDIRSQIRLHNAKNTRKLELVVVDYLQLLAGGKESLTQQVTEISRALKVIAKEFNIPVLALSQLSRAVETRGGKPRLSDLRDSGSIEQDADIVMFLHRENKGDDVSFGIEPVELLIEKHRNGPTGDVKLDFNGSKMTFTEEVLFS